MRRSCVYIEQNIEPKTGKGFYSKSGTLGIVMRNKIETGYEKDTQLTPISTAIWHVHHMQNVQRRLVNTQNLQDK